MWFGTVSSFLILIACVDARPRISFKTEKLTFPTDDGGPANGATTIVVHTGREFRTCRLILMFGDPRSLGQPGLRAPGYHVPIVLDSSPPFLSAGDVVSGSLYSSVARRPNASSPSGTCSTVGDPVLDDIGWFDSGALFSARGGWAFLRATTVDSLRTCYAYAFSKNAPADLQGAAFFGRASHAWGSFAGFSMHLSDSSFDLLDSAPVHPPEASVLRCDPNTFPSCLGAVPVVVFSLREFVRSGHRTLTCDSSAAATAIVDVSLDLDLAFSTTESLDRVFSDDPRSCFALGEPMGEACVLAICFPGSPSPLVVPLPRARYLSSGFASESYGRPRIVLGRDFLSDPAQVVSLTYDATDDSYGILVSPWALTFDGLPIFSVVYLVLTLFYLVRWSRVSIAVALEGRASAKTEDRGFPFASPWWDLPYFPLTIAYCVVFASRIDFSVVSPDSNDIGAAACLCLLAGLTIVAAVSGCMAHVSEGRRTGARMVFSANRGDFPFCIRPLARCDPDPLCTFAADRCMVRCLACTSPTDDDDDCDDPPSFRTDDDLSLLTALGEAQRIRNSNPSEDAFLLFPTLRSRRSIANLVVSISDEPYAMRYTTADGFVVAKLPGQTEIDESDAWPVTDESVAVAERSRDIDPDFVLKLRRHTRRSRVRAVQIACSDAVTTVRVWAACFCPLAGCMFVFSALGEETTLGRALALFFQIAATLFAWRFFFANRPSLGSAVPLLCFGVFALAWSGFSLPVAVRYWMAPVDSLYHPRSLWFFSVVAQLIAVWLASFLECRRTCDDVSRTMAMLDATRND